MTVRELREADVPRVMEIERQSYTNPWTEAVFRAWAAAPSTPVLVAAEDGTEFFSSAPRRGEADGKASPAVEGGADGFSSPRRGEEKKTETVLGYAAMMSVLDEGEIANVAVAPEHRRRGVADALLAALEARARENGLCLLHLEVRAGNESALALYEKHGFAVVGRRKNYYEKPREDAILMTLELR